MNRLMTAWSVRNPLLKPFSTILLIFAVWTGAFTSSTLAENVPVGKMTFTEASVSVIRDADDRLAAQSGTPIFPGDRIETESDARAEFILDDVGTFQMGASTELAIDDLSRADGRSGVIGLFAGYLRSVFQPAENGEGGHSVHTPTVVAGIRGTDFETIVALDGATAVSVHEGAVGVGIDEDAVEVSAGHMVEAEPDAEPASLKPVRHGKKKNWKKWRKAREDRLIQHLPKIIKKYRKRTEKASKDYTRHLENTRKKLEKVKKKKQKKEKRSKDKKEKKKERKGKKEKVRKKDRPHEKLQKAKYRKEFRKSARKFRKKAAKMKAMYGYGTRLEKFLENRRDAFDSATYEAMRADLSAVREKGGQIRIHHRKAVKNIRETLREIKNIKK